jgi:hypothetical protein
VSVVEELGMARRSISVPGVRVAVNPVDEVHSRAAASLASSPLVTMVGLIGKSPPKSWGDRAMRVSDGRGFEIVVGPDSGLANVTPDGSGVVTFAGLTGLARSLATRLHGDVVAMDRTITADQPGTGPFALFPEPLGGVRRATLSEGVMLCPVSSKFAGVVVADGHETMAVVDDVLFLSGACLAAGALLGNHVGPVWERAEEYLDRVQSLGVLIAQAVTDGS